MNQETIEGNKLIAEFMEDIVALNCYEQNPAMLEYHSSWDWLMPVVEKITAINIKNDREAMGYMAMVFESLKTIKIEAVWYAVVEFIKWHNNQNKK